MTSSLATFAHRAGTTLVPTLRDGVAPVLLRIVVGYGFLWHGYAKLGRGPELFAATLHTLGVPLPLLFAWLTTAVELVGGIAILAGAFVAWVSAPLAIVLVTALLTVHLPYGFPSVRLAEVSASGIKFGPVGYEVVLLYLGALGAVAFGGPGPLSVDHWRRHRRDSFSNVPPPRRAVAR
jgi:Predicted membrane protein